MKNIDERILIHKRFDSTVLRLCSRRSYLESNFEVSNGSIEKLVEKIQAKPKLPSFHVCLFSTSFHKSLLTESEQTI